MGFKMLRLENGRMALSVFCDICEEEITDATTANIEWPRALGKEPGSTSNFHSYHKKCGKRLPYDRHTRWSALADKVNDIVLGLGGDKENLPFKSSLLNSL